MRTSVSANIAARVGYSGAKVHRFHVTVAWDERDQTAKVYTGQVYCGSQRWGSSPYVVSLDPTAVNCQRCGNGPAPDDVWETSDRRDISVSDASRIVQRGRSRWLEPTEWAIEQVRPA